MPTFDAADFDNAVSESGTAHESTANTDHTDPSQLKQGYDIANPYLSTDLVGYWPLQEDSGSTAYDFSGNNNDGTINGATVNQTGLLGTTGYSFDDTDDSITGVTQFGGFSALTISSWVKLDNFSSNHTVYSDWDDSNPRAVNALLNNGYSARMHLQDSGGSASFGLASYDISQDISTGEWALLTWTWDGSTVRFYLNAVEKASSSFSASSLDSSSPTQSIGAFVDKSTDYMAGDMTDVRVYNRPLSASEIQTLYDVVATKGDLTTQFKSV